MLLSQIPRLVLIVISLAFAVPAAASTLLQVIELGPGQNIDTIPELDAFDAFEPSDLIGDGELFRQVAYSDTVYEGCEFGSDTACLLSFEDNVDYVVFKAAGYAALYEPWDGVVHVDTSEWGPLYNGGGKSFVPAISNMRAVGAMPEPRAAVVFAAGTTLVGLSIGRRRAR